MTESEIWPVSMKLVEMGSNNSRCKPLPSGSFLVNCTAELKSIHLSPTSTIPYLFHFYDLHVLEWKGSPRGIRQALPRIAQRGPAF
jgi:hypothetical protein